MTTMKIGCWLFFYLFFLDQRKVYFVNTSNFPGLEDVDIYQFECECNKAGKMQQRSMQGVLMEKLVKDCSIYISAEGWY